MMAINEVANLGWFVTDRNQPQGKVCVYVFVPNVEKKRVDVSSMGYAKALAMANLSSIAATQTDADVVRKARQQMTALLFVRETDAGTGDFLFVLDDNRDYRSLAEFRSPDAREMFHEWQALKQQHGRDIELLAAKRDAYAASSAAERENMKKEILELENKVEDDAHLLKLMEYEVRCLEQSALYGNEN